MLAEFLLDLMTHPEKLAQLKENRDSVLARQDFSGVEREAIESGDIHTLRRLLYEEVSHVPGVVLAPLASDNSSFTVSSSCDTPHCPVTQSGLFHKSFWNVMEPDYHWDSKGLTIIGTGIRAGLQTTPEALACIQRASKVLFLVADVLSQQWIQSLNPTAESMQRYYKNDTYRLEIYDAIVEEILRNLRIHGDVCVVFYGHPGAFVYPAHEAIRLAREEGLKARMLPGVSADANLFADLSVDPGVAGVQGYEATNFVLNKYKFDTSAGLLLWQVGMFGNAYWNTHYQPNREHLKILADYLALHYGPEHEVILYEASEFALGAAKVNRVSLSELALATMSGIATLYVPPKTQPITDLEVARQLGIPFGR